jgi:hypothetical protein
MGPDLTMRIFSRGDSSDDDREPDKVNPKGEPHRPQAEQNKGKYTEPKSNRHTGRGPKGKKG